MAKITRTYRLEKDLVERFDKICDETGISKTFVITEAIINFVNKHEYREENTMKIYYDDILVGEVITNRSMSVDEALELIGFDEEKFINENGFDDIDYNDFKLVY